ncbi:hypothetical protein MtrunA17_Chr8g0390591 [Medicago truncatula]|uniref:Uncharacterized protein n=1 Tax=Medicago truncatula TaxID=3880 RepID=A0A396GTG7_MEDTR|nr:hypothetical protein MtrunA17_Chr8g0390591 [Medicago truncatula]
MPQIPNSIWRQDFGTWLVCNLKKSQYCDMKNWHILFVGLDLAFSQ